jgi:hypothetical protein
VEKKAKDKTTNSGDIINNIINDQNQSFSTTNNNDENANKSIESKMKEMEKAFQLNMNLMDALQKELASLKQKELDQQEENKKLKERLAKMETGIQDNANSVLNHDSSNDKKDDGNDITYDTVCNISKKDDADDINATSKLTVTEGNIDALQKELAALKQKELEQHEENQRLKERQARTETGVQSDTNNEPNYDSSDNERDKEDNINYDTEYSNSEEEDEDDDEDNDTAILTVRGVDDDDLHNAFNALQQESQHKYKESHLVKERSRRLEAGVQDDTRNDLNYDSSDNEIDDNSGTNNVDLKKNDYYGLQKDIAALKQKELEQHEENQLLKERLAEMEAGIHDDANNDPYYNSSDNENDDNNDINYDSECSDEEEEGNSTTVITQQSKNHYHLIEIYADPNYDSSDNEDPRNDIYLD